MSARHARIARLARAAVLMLDHAADDIDRGLWTDAELEGMADALDSLTAALRGQDQATVRRDVLVIDSERIDR
ncbi:hypothetical protein SAMN05421805_10289 [Saccharopolyspora antimicrobica]|uniref:Uncharacterized protein n=2 Tax=Saccharopolyspora antimicrobica TaxID=455193 RepID=A0A1I4VAG2_9PSEU|nr:hypothetical protein ATL45_4556 [Saccharopolyspora antimicrobica]SFM98182.1 hypothetical protein SAMN05421805_10289 [Saccharopolyspora antimicrobica]